jgi:protein SCO1
MPYGRMCCISASTLLSRDQRKRFPGIFALALTLALTACVRQYRVQGVVLRVDRAQPSITVSHRAIPGYMDAMAMPFRVKRESELEGIAPGSRVRFVLRGSVASRIRVERTAIGDVVLPKLPERLAVGSTAPDFALTDQSGRMVRLSDLRGRIVAIDFIYTRCPMPDVCPRLSANFARLQKRFGDKVMLLSITLDPEYDTTEVLADYARRWRADADWLFLTGSPPAIREIAERFGVIYWPEDGVLTHTSATAVIDKQGRLAALLEGSSYTSQQLLDLVGQVSNLRADVPSALPGSPTLP